MAEIITAYSGNIIMVEGEVCITCGQCASEWEEHVQMNVSLKVLLVDLFLVIKYWIKKILGFE